MTAPDHFPAHSWWSCTECFHECLLHVEARGLRCFECNAPMTALGTTDTFTAQLEFGDVL